MGSVLCSVCCVGVCSFGVVILVIFMISMCWFVLLVSVGKIERIKWLWLGLRCSREFY